MLEFQIFLIRNYYNHQHKYVKSDDSHASVICLKSRYEPPKCILLNRSYLEL